MRPRIERIESMMSNMSSIVVDGIVPDRREGMSAKARLAIVHRTTRELQTEGKELAGIAKIERAQVAEEAVDRQRIAKETRAAAKVAESAVKAAAKAAAKAARAAAAKEKRVAAKAAATAAAQAEVVRAAIKGR
jgi:hypothetical protein